MPDDSRPDTVSSPTRQVPCRQGAPAPCERRRAPRDSDAASGRNRQANAAATQAGRAAARGLVLELLDREAVPLMLAMPLGLGLLQVFIDDESVENIDVNGADMALVTYANREKLRYGPIADNDDELVATIRSAAARFGLSERRFDAATELYREVG